MPPPTPPKDTKWDDPFELTTDEPEYYIHEIPEREIKTRKQRGRKGMDGLFEIVSSKMARDVTRKGSWMSQNPFDMWNAKDIERNFGKQRYWGRMEDYDNDGLPYEFVVRRGEAPNAPVIAVNGYTTKKSDYPWRYQFYDAYPTKEDRKDKNMKDFIYEQYDPVYGPDNMTVERYSKKDPRTDILTTRVKAHKGYTYPVPVNKTPYQAFSSLIVHELINEIILSDYAGNDKDVAKEIRKEIGAKSGKGLGFASVMCSIIFQSYVAGPIFEHLTKSGLMKQYIENYINGKRKNNPSFDYEPTKDREEDQKFTSWLKSKKEYKETAKNLTATYISRDKIEAVKAALRPEIKRRLDAIRAL